MKKSNPWNFVAPERDVAMSGQLYQGVERGVGKAQPVGTKSPRSNVIPEGCKISAVPHSKMKEIPCE